MADERLTNKERRAQARAERKREQAEAAKKARRQRLTTYGVTLLILLGVGAIVWQAFSGDQETVEGETVARADYEEALAAGCEVVSDQPLASAEHLDPNTSPPAETIYAGAPRPTHSGPHFSATHPVVTDGLRSQGEERALTHNLEHGAVIVWYDPEQVEGSTVDEIESWAASLNESGFTSDGGGAVFVSPYTDPGIATGNAVALRAWGIAVDCASWDETVANGFVVEHFGTHGAAPEAAFSPFPEGALTFSGEPADGATSPDDAASPAETTQEPSPTES